MSRVRMPRTRSSRQALTVRTVRSLTAFSRVTSLQTVVIIIKNETLWFQISSHHHVTVKKISRVSSHNQQWFQKCNRPHSNYNHLCIYNLSWRHPASRVMRTTLTMFLWLILMEDAPITTTELTSHSSLCSSSTNSLSRCTTPWDYNHPRKKGTGAKANVGTSLRQTSSTNPSNTIRSSTNHSITSYYSIRSNSVLLTSIRTCICDNLRDQGPAVFSQTRGVHRRSAMSKASLTPIKTRVKICKAYWYRPTITGSELTRS
jgi:hypothetical protein